VLIPTSSTLPSTTPCELWLDACILHQLKSRHRFVPAAQHLISFSDNNIRVAHGADQQWNSEWADNLTCLPNFIPDTDTHPPEWPSQNVLGSGLTASAPVLDVSAPACTNGVWPPLQPVSVAQDKPSAMLSSNVQSVDFPMDCMAWRFWMMRQTNGCSTPAPRSSAAKQLFEQRAQNKKWAASDLSNLVVLKQEPLCSLKEEFEFLGGNLLQGGIGEETLRM